MSRTYSDRGHSHPVDGAEQRLDAILNVLEDIRDLLQPAETEERPGQTRLREGEAAAAAGEEETPDPPAARRTSNRGGARRGRR